MNPEKTIFKIVTFKKATAKGKPYVKEFVKKFSTPESFLKAKENLQKKGVKKFVTHDLENNTKTLYYKSLGAKNYQKKDSSL